MFPNMIIWFLLLAASASAYIPSLSLLPGDSLSPNPDPTANRLASPDWVAVICHGAWHPPIFYQPLGDALEAQGVESYCPLLPTCNITDVNVEDQSNPVLSEGPPPWGWPTAQGDADVIVDLLNTLIERQGKKVLLIGHSYGGWVASQSALPRLQLQHRQSQGKSGGIFGILGFSAYLIPIGMSMGDFIQEPVPPWSRLYARGKNGFSTPARLNEYLFRNFSLEQRRFYTPQLRAMPVPHTKLTNEAFGKLPWAYVVGEKDPCLLPDQQEQMIEYQRAGGANITIFREQFDHEAQLTSTDQLATVITKFGQSASPKS